MFNNSDSKTNGEEKFFNNIKDKIKIIFDVGCNNYSEYILFNSDIIPY